MPVRPCPSGLGRSSIVLCASEKSFRLESRGREMTVGGQDKAQAVERAARLLAHDDQAARQALASLWEEAFDQGRLAALDELQDRFCVCMK
jgi:hypothetical protein